MDTAVGNERTAMRILEKTPAKSPLTLFEKATSTDDAPAGVPAPITTTTLDTLETTQDVAAVPELGVAPTLAVHANPGMKLVPVTVMVLPT